MSCKNRLDQVHGKGYKTATMIRGTLHHWESNLTFSRGTASQSQPIPTYAHRSFIQPDETLQRLFKVQKHLCLTNCLYIYIRRKDVQNALWMSRLLCFVNVVETFMKN